MRQAKVFYKEEEAGILSQQSDGSFTFSYHDHWINNSQKPGISLTLPKQKKVYKSKHLFPFFYNMLPEGSNKQVVCALNKIDSTDYFGLLLTTAKFDNIGAVSVIKIEE
jgi:serine/threonine-protein kinase HipA